MTQDIKTISADQLRKKLNVEPPNNDDPKEGYALINVLPGESFREDHIPDSINIPKTQLSDFEKRFDKSKEIILYCASYDCPASSDVSRALQDNGFNNVVDFEGGMEEWKEEGYDSETAAVYV